jgi:regulator of protease activity HflC (stomatin/prohibitin superfamily)
MRPAQVCACQFWNGSPASSGYISITTPRPSGLIWLGTFQCGRASVHLGGRDDLTPSLPAETPMSVLLVIVAIILFLLLLFLISAVKVVREYERAIVFRLGRLFPEPKGPGLFILIPIVDRMAKVDLRTITLNIPPQEVITKDNVPARVNAVAYFRIVEPKAAIVQIENFMVATSQIAQTTLRAVLGQHVLDELLSERDKINAILQQIIDEATTPWGIKVARVEVKDLEIPSGMQQAMARQAEAERERRAKIINAEGEFQASERLKDAALVIEEHPTALQLRYLQTLLELGGSQATTIVFPAPIDLIRPFIERADHARGRT